jgi:DNA-binding protein H-NS
MSIGVLADSRAFYWIRDKIAAMKNDDWLASLQNATTEALKDWRQAIDSELKKREGRERAEARKKIKELAEAHGIDLATLAPSGSGKQEPKYRNPNDQFQTWSGVGRKPKWVEEWLAAGKPLEELAIN